MPPAEVAANPPPPTGVVRRFTRWCGEATWAFRQCSGASGFIFRHGLWPHVLLIFILMIAITVSLWTAGWLVAGSLADALLGLLPLANWGAVPGGTHAWLGVVLDWSAHLFLVLPLGLGLLWLQQPVVQALGFPLFDRLTERVDAILNGRPPEHRFDLPRYLRMLAVVALPNALRNLVRSGLCYFLGLIPVIGLYFIARGMVLNAYFSGYGVLENYLENRGLDLRQSHDAIRSRHALATGIGAWVNLLALIPFIGPALALTLGTVGGGLALHAWERRAP